MYNLAAKLIWQLNDFFTTGSDGCLKNGYGRRQNNYGFVGLTGEIWYRSTKNENEETIYFFRFVLIFFHLFALILLIDLCFAIR